MTLVSGIGRRLEEGSREKDVFKKTTLFRQKYLWIRFESLERCRLTVRKDGRETRVPGSTAAASSLDLPIVSAELVRCGE